MDRRTRIAVLAGLAAAALALAACGTGTGGPGTTTPPAPAARPSSLAEARAAWAASGASAGEYRLQLLRQCFCVPVVVDSTVRAGAVVDTSATSPVELGGTGAEVPADQLVGIPRTVDDLHALIAKEEPDAHVSTALYDSQGVPVRLWFDPIENAADDEYGYEVVFWSADVGIGPAADDGSWTRADLPRGASWPADLPEPVRGNAQAVLATDGGATTLLLGLWGSSSCPQVPRTLTLGEPEAQEGRPDVVPAVVQVDGTQPPGTACTEDYGPTVYAASLPSDLAARLTAPTGGATVLQLLLETVGGSTDDPTYQSFVVDAAPVGA